MPYIYLPFNDNELRHAVARFVVQGEFTHVFVHGAGDVSLAGLAETDALFIFAHGRKATGSEIAGKVGFFKRMATMTAPRLAATLEKDGLNKRFGDVRLLVCWSGYVGGEMPWGDDTLKREAGHAPFAGQLCSALKGRGYYRMIVTGYVGSVNYVKPGKPHTLDNVIVTNANKNIIGLSEPLNRPFNDKGVGGQEKLGTAYINLNTENRTVWY